MPMRCVCARVCLILFIVAKNNFCPCHPQVLEVLERYYSSYNSNVHRGVHTLSALATTAYEDAREKVPMPQLPATGARCRPRALCTQVATFVNASSSREVVFTRNASEAINLVANTWGTQSLRPGDEIVLSVLEHHSNLVPWQARALPI